MKTEDEEEAVTEEEVKALLKMGNESGTFDDDEKEMIDSVFKFDRRTAREIMVRRREVIAFDIDDPFEEMIDEILETRHNRIPVYEENIDNIIGGASCKRYDDRDAKHPLKKGDVRRDASSTVLYSETKGSPMNCFGLCRRHGIIWRFWSMSTVAFRIVAIENLG